MKVAYDPILKRPACVILAAILGADKDTANQFPVESWLIEPTPDMKLFETTQEQFKCLLKMADHYDI